MNTSKFDKEIEEFLFSVFRESCKALKRIIVGFTMLSEKKANYIWLIFWTILGILVCRLRFYIWDMLPIENGWSVAKYLIYITVLFPVIYLIYLGQEKERLVGEYNEKFEMIGFYKDSKTFNDTITRNISVKRNYPVFLGRERLGKKEIYTFRSDLSFQDWKKRHTDIETVFDFNIIKLETGKKSKKIIRLHTVPSEFGIEEYIQWSNDYIREKDFEITVGISMLEDVVFDLDKVPHALIAGLTGSGKSVLTRCILWQCIKKGAKIYMVDFKGGVEFGRQYEQFGEVITERDRVVEVLKELVEENTLRLQTFRNEEVKSLSEYNQRHPNKKLCRIVLFCDEVSEMLDKTGVSKSDKKVYEEIEKEMSTLARLARAPGINMILATQRPDAKIIPGQIKNNLPIRISGRMVDTHASEMVLGNTKATEIGDIRGRFMYNIGSDTFEFQAFAFNDSVLSDGDHQIGGMIRDQVIKVAKSISMNEADESTQVVAEDADLVSMSGKVYRGF